MKKASTLITLVTLGLIVLISSCVSVSPSEKRLVVVSGHPDWKPIMYRDGNSISGIAPEVTKTVLKGMGYDVDSRYIGPWDIVQDAAKKGLIDAIVALYKTIERDYLLFSIPYTIDPIVLFFNAGKGFPYDQKKSLIGRNGVATVGDSYGQELDDFIVQANLKMARVYTPKEAFLMLKEGKADYFIYSLYAGRKVIAELRLSGLEESKIISEQPFYIGVSKKSFLAGHMDEINSSLKKMIADKKIPN